MKLIYTLLILVFTLSSFKATSQCDFTTSNTNICGLETVDFNVISPSGNYTWDFDGDGNIDATGANTFFTFPQVNFVSTFSVALFRNGSFCSVQNITVRPTADPSIGVLPGSGVLDGDQIRICSSLPNVTLDIYNASSTYANNVSYTFDWGDGTTEVFDNNTFPGTNFISHDYSGFGYYYIVLTVETSNGCTATQNYTFYNGGNPSVGLATPGNTTGLCAPATVDFPITNTENNPAGTVYNVYVSGVLVQTYTQNNIPAAFTYTFIESSCGLTTSTGNYENAYDVQIEATNPCGSSQATIEPIEVSTPPQLEILIDEPTANCEGEEYTFSNESGGLGEVSSGNPSTCTSLPPTWSITPGIPGVDWEVISGNFFGSDEINVVFYTPGDYTITMSLNSPSCGSGVVSQTFSVLGDPISSATVNLVTAASPGVDECVSTTATFENESAGDSLNYVWNISPSGGWNFENNSTFTTEDIIVNFTQPGNYNVSLSTSNFCDVATWDTTLIIVAAPEIILHPLNDYCETATLNFDASDINLNANNGTFSSIEWSFPGGTPSTFYGPYPTGIYYDAIGTYTVSVTAINECGQSTSTQTFNVQEPGDVAIMPDQTVCRNDASFFVTATPAGGSWSGTGVSPNGFFNPENNNVGDNTLTYSYLDGNCSLTATMIVTVLDLTPTDAGPDQEVCVYETLLELTGASPAGGTWSTDNGAVIIGNTYVDPSASGVGVFNLFYSYTDGNNCTNTSTKIVVINERPDVEAGLDQSICENPFDISLTGFSPLGGTWTGTGVTPMGVFNAGNTPGLGDYTLTYNYVDPNTGCANSDTKVISVIPNEVADAGMDEEYCVNDNPFPISTGIPDGGTWSINGNVLGSNIFDPATAGVGVHVLTYTFGFGVCETSDTKVIEVLDLPNITLPNIDKACVNGDLVDLSDVNPSGGAWSGTGISGNNFDPNVAGVGVHTLTYFYTDMNSLCSNQASLDIEVLPPPTILVNDTSYCNTPGLVDLPSANPSGGTWSGIGIIGNQFDPSIAGGTGNYILTYTYTDGFGCENNNTITATVISPNNVNAGNDFEICVNAESIDLSQMASPQGGTWNSNGSAGLNGNTFNPFTAGVGTHTLTYFLGNGNCQVSDEVEITINDLPEVTTMDDFEVCESENSIILSASPSGGTWTSNNGGVLIVNIFDATASGEGNFSFTYTYQDNNGCENSDNLLVSVNPLPTLTTNDTSYCNSPGFVTLPYSTPEGGTWSGQGVSGNQFDPEIAGGVGIYNLTYSFTDQNGCTNKIISTVSVTSSQEIDAGPNDTLCTLEGTYQLSNFFPTNGTWVGNGITDADAGIFDPVVAGEGLHTITYQFGTGSCFVEDTKTILVVDLSYVTAGPDESTCITYENFSLSGFSPAGGTWTGNGIIDAENGIFDPSIVPIGDHVLTYTFTDDLSGCSFSDEKIMTVFPMENPNFNMPHLVCRNEVVHFENLSPSNYSASWNFGDGNTSSDFTPTYAYDVVGTYVVTLEVENEHGCVGQISDTIVVTDVPVAYFQADSSEACVGLELTLTNLSIGNDLSYEWIFGDNQNTSNLENPGVVYFDNGINDTTYVITLTTTNQCGSSTFQDIVTVHPQPVANIGLSPQTDCSPVVMEFANISVGGATDFYWDYGNGNTSTGVLPETQTYVADSTIEVYTVTLVSSNLCGSDTATTEIIVTPPDVQALPGASQLTGCQPLTVDFYNYATPGATIDWIFGDGNSSAQTEPTHTFTEPGEYNVIQFAGSDCGYDTTSITIIVYPAPEVAFTHPNYVCLNQPIQFSNNSNNTSGNNWNFGDGQTSLLNQPEHIFTEPGEYTVTLQGISIHNQCQANYTSVVTVLDLPNVSFEPAEFSGCVPFEIELSNNSQETIFHEWSFGDGNTSIEENPTHLYNEIGTYEVTLIATDINGCFNDTTISNIIVHPKAEAAFEFERTSLCGLPAQIDFENQSYGATGYTWNFGNGLTTPNTNPSNVYSEAGEFSVELIATNQFSCADTAVQDLRIYPEPDANFDVVNQEGCEPLEVTFRNNSTGSNNFYWDFGNGYTSENENPIGFYQENGLYDVQLIVSIDDACFDTVRLEELINVHVTPVANFEIDETSSGINGGEFQMINLSENADNYYWEFSDGGTSQAVNPRHRFYNNGNKQIYLEASTEFGCVDDTLINFIPKTIKGLFVPNAFSPEQGLGDVRVFKPAGVGMKEYHMQIFSPYGQLLWETQALENGQPAESWDGKVNGKLMAQDVYVWKAYAVFDDGTVWQGEKKKNGGWKTMGSVTLLR